VTVVAEGCVQRRYGECWMKRSALQMAKAGVARLRGRPEARKEELLVSWVKRNGGQVITLHPSLTLMWQFMRRACLAIYVQIA